MIGKKFILYTVFMLLLSLPAFAAAPGLDDVFDLLGDAINFEIEIPHAGYDAQEVNLWLVVGTFLVLYFVFYSLTSNEKLQFLGSDERIKKGFSIGLTLVAIFAAPLVEWLSELLAVLFEFGLILGYIGVFALVFLGFIGIINLTKMGRKKIEDYTIPEEAADRERKEKASEKSRAMRNPEKFFRDYSHMEGEEEGDKEKVMQGLAGNTASKIKREHYASIDKDMEEGVKELEDIRYEINELDFNECFEGNGPNKKFPKNLNQMVKYVKRLKDFSNNHVNREIGALKRSANRVKEFSTTALRVLESKTNEAKNDLDDLDDELQNQKQKYEKGNEVEKIEEFNYKINNFVNKLDEIKKAFIAVQNNRKRYERLKVEEGIGKKTESKKDWEELVNKINQELGVFDNNYNEVKGENNPEFPNTFKDVKV